MKFIGGYIYLVIMTSLLQVFRDGLSSLVMFTIVQNIPMLIIFLMHIYFGKNRHSI